MDADIEYSDNRRFILFSPRLNEIIVFLDLQQIIQFVLAASVIIVAPGPDNIMVIGLGLSRGRRQGMVFGLGCGAGCFNHTLLTAFGVGVLITASSWAFLTLKMCGGGYLIWLGVQALKNARVGSLKSEGDLVAVNPETPFGKLFLRGFLSNIINPKVIVFFLAFLPQFVDSSRGFFGWQIAQLGALFAVETMIVFSVIGFFAGWLGERFTRFPGLGLWLDRSSGAVFIIIGLTLWITRM
ncbi:Threonine/homoserine/homoserine lactone efflux protein [Azospirillaceae bacterium]